MVVLHAKGIVYLWSKTILASLTNKEEALVHIFFQSLLLITSMNSCVSKLAEN